MNYWPRRSVASWVGSPSGTSRGGAVCAVGRVAVSRIASAINLRPVEGMLYAPWLARGAVARVVSVIDLEPVVGMLYMPWVAQGAVARVGSVILVKKLGPVVGMLYALWIKARYRG